MDHKPRSSRRRPVIHPTLTSTTARSAARATGPNPSKRVPVTFVSLVNFVFFVNQPWDRCFGLAKGFEFHPDVGPSGRFRPKTSSQGGAKTVGIQSDPTGRLSV
jgi:hypothetical protein